MDFLKHRFGFYLLLILLFGGACSSTKPIASKYEMRGVWIATVKNIDWPSNQNLLPEEQKGEYMKLIHFYSQHGFNAVVSQVRPATDAFYNSETEVWSEWFNGKQGLEPKPAYDPLNFMIEETHNAGMEFHAWLNPYRAVVDYETADTDFNHITNYKPGWFIAYGKNLYFNPGLPEVRAYLINVVRELVRNYDVDAIHFDDYFYPYKINGVTFDDSLAFVTYGKDFASIDDWRRNNVDELVKELNLAIKEEKPFVKFGISPFGVWRNSSVDPKGSDSKAGQTNYDDLYADILHWMNEGWIDYVVPQLYWHVGFDLADYEKLADWWNKQEFAGHIYIGQAAYRIGNHTAEEWKNPNEMPMHFYVNQKYNKINGNVFFSAKSLIPNPLGFVDSLDNNFYRYPALVPEMKWLDNEDPSPPDNFTVKNVREGVLLQWDFNADSELKYVLVYRTKGNKQPDINNPENILVKIRYPGSIYIDKGVSRGKYSYAITVIDRMNNESTPLFSDAIKCNNQ